MKTAETKIGATTSLEIESYEDAAFLAKALKVYSEQALDHDQLEKISKIVDKRIGQIIDGSVRAQISDWVEVHETDHDTVIYQNPHYYRDGREIDFSDFSMDDPDWDGFLELSSNEKVLQLTGEDRAVALEAVENFSRVQTDVPTGEQVRLFIEKYKN